MPDREATLIKESDNRSGQILGQPSERGWLWMLLLTLVGSALIITLYLWNEADPSASNQSVELDKPATSEVVYTCSMDPQVKSEAPGPCPICGMPLTPMDAQFTGDTLQLTGTQQLAMGLKVLPLNLGMAISRWLAQVVERTMQSVTVSSRLGGRIVRVSRKAPGQAVAEGEALVWLFNPDLVTAQSEYLTSEGPQRQLARERLYAMGISRESIKQLDSRSEPNGQLVVRAGKSGILMKPLPRNSQMVSPGQSLAQIQLSGVGKGSSSQAILIEAYLPSGFGGQTGSSEDPTIDELTTKAGFLRWESGKFGSEGESAAVPLTAPQLLPELDAQGRTVLRLLPDVSGVGRQSPLTPGQRGEVVWQKKAKRGTIKPPPNAILQGGEGPVIWIATDKAGVFIRRQVTMNRAGEATSGLSGEEKVVVKGANLLQAEWQLRAGKR